MSNLLLLWGYPVIAALLAGALAQRPLHGATIAAIGALPVFGIAHIKNTPLSAALFWIGLSLMVSGVLLLVALAIWPDLKAFSRAAVCGAVALILAATVTYLINTVPFG